LREALLGEGMRARVAVALLLVPLALAGCTGPSTSSSPGAGATAAAGAGDASAASLPMPAWAVRDAWTYRSGDATVTYVVTADQGGDWFMETDSPERAFANLRDDVSRLGPQRKSDLAGSQGSDRVEFFQWPLTDGKTWTTLWDHQPVAITAHVAAGVATLEAKDRNGTMVYHYTYDPAVRWFKELHHYGADGKEVIGFTLVEAKHGWTGKVARWALQEVTHAHGDLASGPDSAVTFDVPLTATDVWAKLDFTCASGSVLGGVDPFPVVTSVLGVEPRGIGDGGLPCPVDAHHEGSAGAPKAPPQGGSSETWSWAVVAPAGTVGTYNLEVLVRTLTMAPVG
jgi:hypothetical protein